MLRTAGLRPVRTVQYPLPPSIHTHHTAALIPKAPYYTSPADGKYADRNPLRPFLAPGIPPSEALHCTFPFPGPPDYVPRQSGKYSLPALLRKRTASDRHVDQTDSYNHR